MEAELADTEEKLEKQTEHLQQVPSLEDIQQGVAQNCQAQMMDALTIPLCVYVKVKTYGFYWLLITQYFGQLFLGLSHWVDKKYE